tara:strand:- start:221 stop:733 length:513 start_codon:yes stop_codon:yes gene_type:complete
MGADACSSVIGNSSVDRFGCYDSDGDGHSNKDDNWGYSDGADGYPDDPTRWGPPPNTDGMSFGTVTIAGGGILVVIIIGSLLFIRGRRGNKQYDSMNMNYQMQQNSAMLPQQGQTYQQNNPVNVQYTQTYPQQTVQSDPAREYYQNLVNQGYPHEHAVAYTQQYFPSFMG